MDLQRAKQILHSEDSVQVLHQGSPVWIDHVSDNSMADITYLDGHKKTTVPLTLLVEGKNTAH